MITFADVGMVFVTLCYVVSVFILLPLLGIAMLWALIEKIRSNHNVGTRKEQRKRN